MSTDTKKQGWQRLEAWKAEHPQHSPTPWHVGASGAMVYDALGVPVSNCVIRETELSESGVGLASNAALIVQAVNSHAELVEALRNAQTGFNRLFAMSPEGSVARQYAENEADAVGTLLSRLGG